MSDLEVQNGEVYQAREPLQALLKQPLPVKVAYGLTKLARKIGEQYADIEAVRSKLIQQYGKETAKDQFAVEPSSEQWPEFVSAYNELMSEKVTLENVWRVTLPTNNGLEVTAEMLMRLEPFVAIEEIDE